MSLIYDIMPWLSQFTKRLPIVSGKVQQFYTAARARTAKRVRNGSQTKDLFYYLVSL